MKRFMQATLIMIFACLLAACGGDYVKGNGDVVTKPRNLPVFEQIKVGGAFRISIRVGADQGVTVKTDSNIEPLIVTTVQNGVLDVHTKSGFEIQTKKPVEVSIKVQKLTDINLHGAAQLRVSGLKGDEFTLRANGATKAKLAGILDKLTILVSGAGKVDAKKLRSQDVRVQVSGAGNIQVNARKKLDAKISGAGRVIYAGNPKEINRSISGSGRLEKD